MFFVKGYFARSFAVLLLLVSLNHGAWGIVSSSQGLLRHEHEQQAAFAHTEIDQDQEEATWGNMLKKLKDVGKKAATTAMKAGSKAAGHAYKAAQVVKQKLKADGAKTPPPPPASKDLLPAAYTPIKGLEVTVYSATNVKNFDSTPGTGESDVYVKVKVHGVDQLTTKAITNSKNPEWKQKGDIWMWYEPVHLEFQMWDSDIGLDNFIGNAWIAAKDIIEIADYKEFNLAINGATLKVGIKPMPGPEEMPVTMAKLAYAIYSPENSPVGDWDLGDRHVEIKSFFEVDAVSNDKAGLYVNRKDGSCAIAFSGSDDLFDWIQDADIRTTTGCGYKDLHNGFYGELLNYVKSPAWKTKIQEYAMKKCTHITAVGHSLGGAVASLLTACASDPQRNEVTDYLGFQVNALYTVGAPGVVKSILWNRTSEKVLEPSWHLAPNGMTSAMMDVQLLKLNVKEPMQQLQQLVRNNHHAIWKS
jgi:hypothetical protein